MAGRINAGGAGLPCYGSSCHTQPTVRLRAYVPRPWATLGSSKGNTLEAATVAPGEVATPPGSGFGCQLRALTEVIRAYGDGPRVDVTTTVIRRGDDPYELLTLGSGGKLRLFGPEE